VGCHKFTEDATILCQLPDLFDGKLRVEGGPLCPSVLSVKRVLRG
jgi:hypothetical protein